MTAQHAARHRVETDLLFGLDAVIVRKTVSQSRAIEEPQLLPSPEDSHSLHELKEHHASECYYCTQANVHAPQVFGEGAPDSKLMFIGGIPNEHEAQTGTTFAGPEGDLLANMLKPMGYARQDVYITNVLKSMPQKQHDITSEDFAHCHIWLHRQIELVNPAAIISLGEMATQVLLGVEQDISDIRGEWGGFSSGNRIIPVMPTFDPAFVLGHYTKEIRGLVWNDLQKVMEKLKEVSSQI